MFQREVIGNVGGKPAYGNAVGVVNSFWRTSEIRAGIILGRILQRDLLDEWECCWRGNGVLGVGAPLQWCRCWSHSMACMFCTMSLALTEWTTSERHGSPTG